MEIAVSNQKQSLSDTASTKSKQTLVWRDDDRMGGRVPVWTSKKTSQETIASDLSMAEKGIVPNSFEGAMAYAQQEQSTQANVKPFGIGDVIDMVNPLQHIPVVGHIYRKISGDEIGGIAKVIGGSVYGGFGGLASGIADTIVTEETGQGITENAVRLVMRQPLEEPRTAVTNTKEQSNQDPSRQLEQAINNGEQETAISDHAISFVDLGGGKRMKREYIDYADGRTAGKVMRETVNINAPVHVREPITQVTFDPMPLLEAQENRTQADLN